MSSGFNIKDGKFVVNSSGDFYFSTDCCCEGCDNCFTVVDCDPLVSGETTYCLTDEESSPKEGGSVQIGGECYTVTESSAEDCSNAQGSDTSSSIEDSFESCEGCECDENNCYVVTRCEGDTGTVICMDGHTGLSPGSSVLGNNGICYEVQGGSSKDCHIASTGVSSSYSSCDECCNECIVVYPCSGGNATRLCVDNLEGPFNPGDSLKDEDDNCWEVATGTSTSCALGISGKGNTQFGSCTLCTNCPDPSFTAQAGPCCETDSCFGKVRLILGTGTCTYGEESVSWSGCLNSPPDEATSNYCELDWGCHLVCVHVDCEGLGGSGGIQDDCISTHCQTVCVLCNNCYAREDKPTTASITLPSGYIDPGFQPAPCLSDPGPGCDVLNGKTISLDFVPSCDFVLGCTWEGCSQGDWPCHENRSYLGQVFLEGSGGIDDLRILHANVFGPRTGPNCDPATGGESICSTGGTARVVGPECRGVYLVPTGGCSDIGFTLCQHNPNPGYMIVTIG